MSNQSKIKKDKRKAERLPLTPAPPKATKNASWTEAEERAAITYLRNHKGEAGNGGNFPDEMFNSCARHIAPLLVRGAVKEGKHIKSKYQEWRRYRTVIRKIKKKSGWSYTEEGGANINSTNAMQEGRWKAWVQKLEAKHQAVAKKFKNKGWPLYDLMDQIYPERAKGTRAYYASKRAAGNNGLTSSDEDSGSEDEDEEEEDVAGVGDEEDDTITAGAHQIPQDQPHPISQAEPVVPSVSRPSTPPPASGTPQRSTPATPSFARVGDKRVPTSPTAQKHAEKKKSRTDLAFAIPMPRQDPASSSSTGKYTGPVAMIAISRSLEDHGRNVRAGLETAAQMRTRGIDLSPVRVSRAMSRAQELEKDWLTAEEMVDLIDVFDDKRAADKYLALHPENVALRKLWVSRRIGKGRVEDVFT